MDIELLYEFLANLVFVLTFVIANFMVICLVRYIYMLFNEKPRRTMTWEEHCTMTEEEWKKKMEEEGENVY